MKKQSKALETGEYWVACDWDCTWWGFKKMRFSRKNYEGVHVILLKKVNVQGIHHPVKGLRVGFQIEMKAREVGK